MQYFSHGSETAALPKTARGYEMSQQIKVTPEQAERIESAWEICSYGSGRIASGRWAKTFQDCVREVIGSEVPETFSLCII